MCSVEMSVCTIQCQEVASCHKTLGIYDFGFMQGAGKRELRCIPVHGLLNAPQEVPGPHDTASHQGGVSGPGRVAFLLLVDLLDCFQVFEIVVEDDLILGLQIRLQTDSLTCLVTRNPSL